MLEAWKRLRGKAKKSSPVGKADLRQKLALHITSKSRGREIIRSEQGEDLVRINTKSSSEGIEVGEKT